MESVDQPSDELLHDTIHPMASRPNANAEAGNGRSIVPAAEMKNLPPELWATIFNKISVPPNQLNNSRLVSSHFQGIIDSLPERKYQQVFLLICPYLNRPDLMNMRTLSKSNKISVDLFLDQNPGSLSSRSWNDWFYTVTSNVRPFTCEADVIQFCSTFQNVPPTQNPIPGRGILLENTVEQGTDNSNFLASWSPLLSRWGSHLWSLGIFDPYCLNYAQGAGLEQTLRHVPNLKTLEWIFWWQSRRSDAQLRLSRNVTLPPLPYLKSMCLLWTSSQAAKLVVKLIAEYSGTLENLTLNGITIRPSSTSLYHYAFPKKITLPNLKTFNVGFVGGYGARKILSTWNMPALIKLIVNFEDNVYWKTYTVGEAVMAISKNVGATLKYLCVQNAANLCYPLEDDSFIMPRLETLFLANLKLPLADLANLPALKLLDLDSFYYEHFTRDAKRLDPIWKDGKNLQEICVNGISFARIQ